MDFAIKESTLGVDSPIIKPNPGFLTQVGEERFRKLVDDHYENIRDSDIAFMFPVDYPDEFAKVKKHVWLESFASLLPKLVEEGINPEYIQSFWNYLERFSSLLVNIPAIKK